MYNYLSKNGQLFAFLTAFILSAAFLVIAFAGLPSFDALGEKERVTSNIFNFGLWAAIILTVIAFILAIIFGLKQFASNPKGSMTGLLAIAGMAVLYYVGKAIAGADSAGTLAARKEFNVTDAQSGMIDGWMNGGIILSVLALAIFILAEIRNFFK